MVWAALTFNPQGAPTYSYFSIETTPVCGILMAPSV